MFPEFNVRIAGIDICISCDTEKCDAMVRDFLREFTVDVFESSPFRVEFSEDKDLLEFGFRHSEEDREKNVLGMTVGMGHIDKGGEYAVVPNVASQSMAVAEFVLDNFLRICLQYAAPSRGCILMHSSAVVHEGKSFVFIAPNGGGKSTIAFNSGRPVLSDDCVGISKGNRGKWMACSTPWGDIHTNGEYPIAGLFFIEKSSGFFCDKVSSMSAVKRLFSNVSLSFSDMDGCSSAIMDDILGIVTGLSVEVPVLRLGFRKDDNVLDIMNREQILWSLADYTGKC